MRDTKVAKTVTVEPNAMALAMIVTLLDSLYCGARLSVVKAVAAYYGWTVTN